MTSNLVTWQTLWGREKRGRCVCVWRRGDYKRRQLMCVKRGLQPSGLWKRREEKRREEERIVMIILKKKKKYVYYYYYEEQYSLIQWYWRENYVCINIQYSVYSEEVKAEGRMRDEETIEEACVILYSIWKRRRRENVVIMRKRIIITVWTFKCQWRRRGLCGYYCIGMAYVSVWQCKLPSILFFCVCDDCMFRMIEKKCVCDNYTDGEEKRISMYVLCNGMIMTMSCNEERGR